MRKKLYLFLSIAMGICLMGAVPAFADEAGTDAANEAQMDLPSVPMGEEVPDFSYTTIDGETFTLSEVLKEKQAALVNFFKVDCTFCIEEFPVFEKLSQKYSEKLGIIALDSLPGDTEEDVKELREEENVKIPLAMETDRKLSEFIPYEGYPCTVIIDRFGKLVFYQDYDFKDDKTLEEVLSAILADDYKGGYSVANQYNNELLKMLEANLGPASKQDAAEKGYIVEVVDQDGNGVPGVAVNFCSDNQGKCMMNFTDDKGAIIFRDLPEESYHVQVLAVPEGYSYEDPLEAHTTEQYNELRSGGGVTLVIHKD